MSSDEAFRFGSIGRLAAVAGVAVIIFGNSSPSSAAQHSTPWSTSVHAPLMAAYGNLPLDFERNEGQADTQAKFLARG